MKWIKIKDRLPKTGEAVLTCNMKGICLDEREPVILYIEESDNNWYIPWDMSEKVQEIPTHWMTLPKLPKLTKEEIKEYIEYTRLELSGY